MATSRFVRKEQANKKQAGASEVHEYFTQEVPTLGLATAILRGQYPPEEGGKWSRNNKVDEMWFVIDGSGEVVFEDGASHKLAKYSAVHLPLGLKYCVRDAKELFVVVTTGPAWTLAQREWIKE